MVELEKKSELELWEEESQKIQEEFLKEQNRLEIDEAYAENEHNLKTYTIMDIPREYGKLFTISVYVFLFSFFPYKPNKVA